MDDWCARMMAGYLAMWPLLRTVSPSIKLERVNLFQHGRRLSGQKNPAVPTSGPGKNRTFTRAEYMRVLGPHLPVCCCRLSHTHATHSACAVACCWGGPSAHTPGPGPQHGEQQGGGEGVRFRGRGLAVPLARRPELQGARRGYFLSR